MKHSIWTEKIYEGRAFLASRFLAKGIGRWTALCITGVFIRRNIRVCFRNPKCRGPRCWARNRAIGGVCKRIFKGFIGRYWVYNLDSKFTFAPSKT